MDDNLYGIWIMLSSFKALSFFSGKWLIIAKYSWSYLILVVRVRLPGVVSNIVQFLFLCHGISEVLTAYLRCSEISALCFSQNSSIS